MNLRAVPLLVVALGWMTAPAPGQATNAPAAGASTNAPAAAPASVPLATVVSTAVDDSNKLQEIQAGLAADRTVADGQQALASSNNDIGDRKKEADRLLDSAQPTYLLRTTSEVWQMLAKNSNQLNQTLTSRLSQLDANDAQLGEMDRKWKATLATLKASSAPPDILERIAGVITGIAQTSKSVAQLRGKILSTQVQLTNQKGRIDAEILLLSKKQANADSQLFTRDSQPIWAIGTALPVQPVQNVAPGVNPLTPEIAQLRDYVGEKAPIILLHLLVFNIFALVMFYARREVGLRTKDDPELQRSAQVFEVPLAMAAVLALLLSWWFYPLDPRLFRAGLGAAALVPAVIVLRRLIEPALFPILYAMVIAYLVDQLRIVAEIQPLVVRFLFLAEMIGVIAFLVWLVRSKRLSQAGHDLLERAVRTYAYFALAIFAVLTVANLLGYTQLSYLKGNGMLAVSYVAVILYAAVRIADGLILAAIKMRPFSMLGMVRRHSVLIAGKISTFFRWAAFLWWAWVALDFLSLRAPLVQHISAIFTYTIPYGSLDLSLWPVVLFGLTIWVTVLVSRLIRFLLEEEVYPNLRLGPGVPYATSTMVHYTVLVLGTLFALSAVKIDLSKYSVLAGALGVGLGFGLQNIMNNFVSGIILLFERPIKVGDVIQVDTAMGTVESIGIRASVIRITNGSEIIMPNGSLISNQVTNWTFSDRRRVIDIPVTVAAKSEPQKVMSILIETAKANPAVLKDPPPQVLFTNFTGGNLNFELRAWTNSTETWGQIRSDLSLAISAALAKEDIAVS